jgi:hypothetical protein
VLPTLAAAGAAAEAGEGPAQAPTGALLFEVWEEGVSG